MLETIDDFSEGSSIRTVEEALQWVEKAYCKSRAPHHGDSRRTQFRRQAEKKRRLESAKGNMKITSFFNIKNQVIVEEPESESEQNCSEPNLSSGDISTAQLSLVEAIQRLRIATRSTPNTVQQRQLQIRSNGWEFMCLLAVRQYLKRLQSCAGI